MYSEEVDNAINHIIKLVNHTLLFYYSSMNIQILLSFYGNTFKLSGAIKSFIVSELWTRITMYIYLNKLSILKYINMSSCKENC